MKATKTILLAILILPFVLIARPISEDDIFKTPSLFSVKLSPKEKYYSYVVSKANTYILKVHHIKAKKFVPLVFEKLEASRISEYKWLDSNTIYVSYKLKNGSELERLISLNFYNNKFNVKVDNINANGFIVDTYPEQDNKVLYALRKRTNTRYIIKLYEVSHQNLIQGNIKELPEFSFPIDDASVIWSSGGVLGALIIDGDEWEYRELNKSKGKWEFVFGDEIADYEFKPVGRLSNGSLAVLSDYETNVVSLYEFDVKTKSFIRPIYQHGKYDLVDADIDPVSKKVKAVHYYDHGRYVSEYLINDYKDIYSSIKSVLPNKQFLLESTNSKNYFVVNAFSSIDRGVYYLFDNNKRELKTIGAIQEELEKYTLSKTIVETLQVEEGVEIETYFTKPEVSNGVLLVMPHGGPIGVREYENFDHEVQYLASRGFTILRVNFRGSAGFGKSFREQGVGEFGRLIEQDISHAVDNVLKSNNFKNVCAIGASYGAYSSLMLAKQKPELYDCVIARFGVYDLPLLFSSSNLFSLAENRERIEKVVGKNSVNLYDLSPLYYLDSIKAPILLTAGEKDEVAYFEHSKRLKYRLEQLQSEFEYVFYKNAGHGHPTWFGDQHELATIYDFLIRKLNIKDNNPSELGQSFAKIADGFDNKFLMDVKEKKAFDYYKKASVLNQPRSIFNIGSYYHRGKFVDYNLDTAIKYYENAAQLDYSNASYRLGDIYYDNIYTKPNYTKAYDYYSKAKEQKHRYASLDLAKFKCLGINVDKDVRACLKEFNLKIDSEETPSEFSKRKQHRDNVIRDILLNGKFNQDELIELKKYIAKGYKVKEFAPKVEVDDWGLFESNNHEETTEFVPIQKNQKFGVVLNIEAGSNEVEDGDKSLFLIKWTTPLMKDKQGVPQQQIQSGMWTTKVGNKARIMYILNRDWELIKGEWKIEVFDINNKILFKKIFKTIPQ